jgi:hypothetical protein
MMMNMGTMNTWLNKGRAAAWAQAWLLAAAVALGLAWATGSVAQSAGAAAERNDIFTIRNVAVDVTAGSAAEARARAMQQGQLKAFDILMRRILAEEDWSRAPQVEAGALGNLVSSLEVSGERSSAVRYIATLTVQFHPPFVRELLKNNGLAFTQTMASSVLVVPFMQYLGADYLWQDDNPWRAAWQAHDLSNRLAAYTVAKGDAMDRLMAPPFEVLAGSANLLQRLAGRYETEQTVVAVLTLEPDLAGAGLVADVRLLSASGEELVLEDVAVAAADTEAGVEGAPAAPTADMLAPLVEAVVAARDSKWKAATLVRMDQGGDVTLLAPLKGLKNWTELQRRLDRVNLVQKVTLAQLSAQEARLEVRYIGTWDSLTVALEGAGLRLLEQGAAWALYLAEAAPKQAPRAAAPASATPQGDWVDVGEPAFEPR